jgi:hypothetical protein
MNTIKGTDSPAPRIPLDPKEQPILDQLLSVRTKLELLKQDRSTYVKSQDVLDLYNEVIEQVIVLNELRTTKRLEQNRGKVPEQPSHVPTVSDTAYSRLCTRRLLPTNITGFHDNREESRSASSVSMPPSQYLYFQLTSADTPSYQPPRYEKMLCPILYFD